MSTTNLSAPGFTQFCAQHAAEIGAVCGERSVREVALFALALLDQAGLSGREQDRVRTIVAEAIDLEGEDDGPDLGDSDLGETDDAYALESVFGDNS